MKRLTKIRRSIYESESYAVYISKDGEQYSAIAMTAIQTQQVLDRLAMYEDLDECGRVIRDEKAQKMFAYITIDKEDMQEMIDKKCSELFAEAIVDFDNFIDRFVCACRELMDRKTACVSIEDIEDIGKELKEEWRQNET